MGSIPWSSWTLIALRLPIDWSCDLVCYSSVKVLAELSCSIGSFPKSLRRSPPPLAHRPFGHLELALHSAVEGTKARLKELFSAE